MQNKNLNQIENKAEDLEKTLTRNSIWDRFSDVFYYKVDINDQISISVLDVIILITVIVIASVVLNTLYKIITKRLPEANKNKFSVFYGYFKWLIYIIIFLIAMHSVGISVTAFFAASAALLIGIGLALQTLFQDTISGIFILVDQSVHVGDIIEIDGKVGRIIEIKLRTTRAVTIE